MEEILKKALSDERLSDGAFRMLCSLVDGSQSVEKSSRTSYRLKSELNELGYLTDKNDSDKNVTTECIKNETIDKNGSDKNDTVSTKELSVEELRCDMYFNYLKGETITVKNLEKVRKFIENGMFKLGNTDEGIGVLARQLNDKLKLDELSLKGVKMYGIKV